MDIEEKLKALIVLNYGSIKTFSNETGIAYTTVLSILKRGILKSGVDNVISICKTLNISVEELLQGNISFVRDANLDKSSVCELDAFFAPDYMTAHNAPVLTLDGLPITSDEYQIVLDAVEIAAKAIKRKRDQ